MAGVTVTVQELARASRVIADAVRDKSYRATPIGLAAARYLRWKRNDWGARPETIREYESTLAALALDHAHLELRDFEPPVGYERLSDWRDQRWGHRSAATRAKQTSILRDFFRWAVQHDHLVGDPTTRMRRPRPVDPARPTFSDAEVEQIIRACGRLRDLVAASLILCYGLRKGEIRRVRLSDYQDGVLSVDGKGGRRRTIPLVDPIIMAAFREHQQNRRRENRGWRGEYLLHPEKWLPGGPDEGMVLRWEAATRPYSEMGMQKWWERLLNRAGVDYKRMHTGRHTALTAIWRRTGDLELVRQVAGHKSIATTADIYVHSQTDELRRKLEEAFRPQ